MRFRTEIILMIVIIFMAIIGGVSANEDNHAGDAVSVADDSSLADMKTNDVAEVTVTGNGSTLSTSDPVNENELAETGDSVSVSNSNNGVLGASADQEVLGATFNELNTLITSQGNTKNLNNDYDSGYRAITISKNLVVNGNNHIIDAYGQGRIFSITGAYTVTFNDVTFKNARTTGNNDGGVFSVTGGATLTFNNCTFIDNAARDGGAIYVYSTSASMTLTNCKFIGNNGRTSGGAVYAYMRSISIDGCVFEDNTGYDEGGAIHLRSLSTETNIRNSNFTNNRATSVVEGDEGIGGGIRVNNVRNPVNVINCIFTDNFAYRGAGIYSPYGAASSEITGSKFYNNTATSLGGGMYWNANSTTFTNCEFSGNEANNGAGLFLAYAVFNTQITDCTFTDNKASNEGGAIMGIYYENNLRVTGSTFTANTALNGGAIALGQNSHNFYLNNCKFSENKATDYGGCIYFETNGDNVNILNSNFSDNVASSGGAIDLFASLTEDSYNTVNIINCQFTGNNATSSDSRYGGSAVALNWANDVTIQNCLFDANNANANGAVYLDYTYDVEVTDSKFTNNNAGGLGGGLFAYDVINGATIIFTRCDFENNTAGSGGAISTNLFSVNYENLGNVYRNWQITDCDFINNGATSSGGALYLPWTTGLVINNVPFENNSAGANGAMYWSGDSLSITGVNFTNNKATSGDCGALYIGVGTGSASAHSLVDDVIFENNSAYSNGGALAGAASNVNVTNDKFINNKAWYGGAIYWSGGSNLTIDNDEFTGNSANNAGAVDIYGTTNAHIYNSNFTNNKATAQAGAVWFNSIGGNIFACDFTNNTAGTNGAAIILDSTGQTVQDCTFTNNRAGGRGGAIYDTGTGADNANFIKDSAFVENEAYDGGAAYITDGRITQIYNATFIDNVASHNGGAAYITVDGIHYVDYDLFKHTGVYDETSERFTWNMGGRDYIYSSLLQNNIDYFMNVSHVVSGLTAVITVNVPADANKSRNGKVRFEVTYTNESGSYLTIYELDDFDDSGIVTLNLPNSRIGHYDVIVGFSEDTYLYKQFNLSYDVNDPRGDFEILQDLVNKAIESHQTELNLTRDYTFTVGNETDPLDFNWLDVDITSPLIINGNGWTINALGYCRIFNITSDNVVIRNVTLINGNNATSDGGAIYWSGSNGTVESTFFINNTATSDGGAIYYAPTATDCKVIDCTFENNTAGDNGGAIDWNATTGVLNGTTFINNKAGDNGGALCREENAAGGYGNNNVFISNTATQGGAIAWMKSESITINKYTFIDNTAEVSGGAIFVGEGSGNCIINESYFEGNNVTRTTGGHGGAIEWYAQSGAVYTSTFNNNHAYKGGAIFVGQTSGDINITDSTFTNNSAVANGGAIDVNASSVIIVNSNLSGNTAENGGAIYVGGSGEHNSVTSCTFTNNNATGNGGAVDWAASNGYILESTFEYNNAENGGAVYIGGDASDGSIINSTFNYNHANENGGAVDWNSTIGRLINSTFEGNTAKYGGATYRGANSAGGFGYGNTYISNHAEINGGAIDWNSAGGNITNSKFYNNTAGGNGGAVYVGAVGATAYITDSLFEGNNATGNGGAVDWESSNGHILDSKFEYNNAENGGAVYIGGDASEGSIIGSEFNYNHANENGGAVDWNSTIGRLINSTFEGNTAKYGGATYRGANSEGGFGYNNEYRSNIAEIDGGAIYWNAAAGNITNSRFYDNIAGHDGGAVYVGAVGATAYITDSLFIGNNATENGGAVNWESTNGNILRTIFESNYAGNDGGAAYIGGSADAGSIVDSEFSYNTAGHDGGAVNWNAAGGNITNSKFTNNVAGSDGGAIDVEASGATTYVTDSTFTGNNATENGGAINWESSNGYILNSKFDYNNADLNGGAVFIGGSATEGSIINSSFSYNHANENGGAIDWNSTIGILIGSNFTFNTAKYGGATFRGANATGGYGYNNRYISNYAEINGGAIDWNATGGNITHSYFYNNIAGENGGAVFVGANGATAYITDAVFEENRAGNRGGAIDIFASDAHIIGSNFTDNSADYGGAVFAGNNADQSEISDSIFLGNSATYNGGAVDWNASSGIITDSRFEQNTADYGGAVFVGTSSNDGYIIGSNFTNNAANVRGGAVDWNGSSGHVNDSIFEGNEAIDGGAMYLGSGASNGNVYNCSFVSNRADGTRGKGGAILFHTVDQIYVGASNFTSNSADHAGAIYIEECNGAVIETSEFTSNSANNDGAIHWQGENGILRDSLFTSNTATEDAGAIGWKGVSSNITNVTFDKNTAGGKAGAIYWVNVSGDEISNVTFTENQANKGGAVYWESGNGVIYDAVFDSNVAFERGGAVYITGLSGNALRNATFTLNQATGHYNPQGIEYGDGGAIYITDSDNMELNDLTFENNGAALKGGAIFVNNTDDSVLDDLTFKDNRVNKVGGTIYWEGSTNVTIYEISINGSVAHDEGGAIYLTGVEGLLENITLDQTTSSYASGGAIYANGNITINNATLTNFQSLNFIANAIMLDGGNSTVANSTLTGNNAIVVGENTEAHIIKNTIRDSPDEGYAVLNEGTLYLDGNDFDDVIINAGVIETQTYTVVLGNKTVNATKGDNVQLNATIVDDTQNNDIVVVETFKFNVTNTGELIDSTYSGRANYGTFENVAQGKYIISASDVGLKVNDILTGTLLVKSPNTIEFNITQINEGENVTIKVDLLPEDNEFPYEGNISLVVNGTEYNLTIVNGSGILKLHDVPAGTYPVTATYPGDDYHTSSTNSTNLIVNLRETQIIIVANNVTYGQNVTAIATTNANGTVQFLLNGKTIAEIVDGVATWNITGLEPDVYEITVIYPGNAYFATNYNQTTFEVYKNNASIESIDFAPVVHVGEANTIIVTMANVTSGVITIEVNGTNYTASIVNKVAKLNVTLPVGKDYAVKAYFTGDKYFNPTNMTGGTFEVTAKNVTIINITSLEVVEVDGRLIINFTTNTDAALNATVNGKPITLVNNAYDANTTVAGTYTLIVTSPETAKFSAGYNMTVFTVVKHNSTADISIAQENYTAGSNFTITVTTNAPNVVVTINGKTYELDGDGKVIVNTTALAAGEYTVVATVTEDAKYYGNTSSKVFNIVKANSTVNVTVENVVYGNDAEIVVKVPVNQTGTVSINVNNQNYTVEINNGEARLPISDLNVGDYTVKVVYAGDNSFNPSNNTTSFSVTPADLTASVTARNITVSDNSTFTVDVNSDFKGNVSITVDGVTYNGTVKSIIEMAKLTAGNKTATVTFYGDGNYNDLTLDVNFTVSKLDPTIRVVDNHDGTVTVIVPDGATGEVNVTVEGKNFTATIVNGTAVVALENVSSGQHNITVSYPGDDNYNNATLNATVDIRQSDVPIDVTVQNITVGDVETIVVSVGNNATGNVTIYIDGKEYTEVIENGNATFVISDLTAGNKTVAVSYNGDKKHVGNSTSANFVVSKRASWITVNVEATTVGSPVTINVEIPSNATGSVVIDVDGTNYTITTSAGKGSLTIDGVGNVTHDVKVTYLGDGQYLNSTNSTTYGLSKLPSTVTVEAENIYEGEVATLNITVTTGATGNVTIVIMNGTTVEYEKTVGVTNGKITVSVPGLTDGEKTVQVTYNGDDKYLSNSNSTTLTVDIKDAVLITSDVTSYYNKTNFTVRLADSSNNPIAHKQIQVVVNGKTYTAVTDEYGDAVIELELPLGKFTAETSYTDAQGNVTSVNNTITMLSSIEASDMTRGWNSPYDYFAGFYDGNGNVLANQKVTFIVNGNSYTVETDANGIGYLKLKLAVGEYNVTVINDATGEVVIKQTTIVKRIIENKDITMDFVDGTYYVARVIGDDGNPVGAGEFVDVYINTVHYSCRTEKDGYLRLQINLNPATYNVTVEYKTYKVSNKVVVKQTLKLVKKTISIKRGKTLVLKATLKWSNGKAIKGKKIIFNFKGKNYSAKTNSKGLAKVTIKGSVTKKIKKGKKYFYSAKYLTNRVKGTIKFK